MLYVCIEYHMNHLGVDERMINVHSSSSSSVAPIDVGSANVAPTDVAAVDVAPKERHL